jgi:hypothetical protein
MVIFSPQTIALMCPSSMDSQVCKKSSDTSSHGTIHWTTNKPPKLTRSTHCRPLDVEIHWSIFWFFFPSIGAHHLHLIMYLDQALVGTTIGM